MSENDKEYDYQLYFNTIPIASYYTARVGWREANPMAEVLHEVETLTLAQAVFQAPKLSGIQVIGNNQPQPIVMWACYYRIAKNG